LPKTAGGARRKPRPTTVRAKTTSSARKITRPFPLKPSAVSDETAVGDEVAGVKCTETTKTLWLRTKAIAVKSETRNHDHGRGRVRKSDVV
jgi:hypothetical protein